jgi:hypothetical protein
VEKTNDILWAASNCAFSVGGLTRWIRSMNIEVHPQKRIFLKNYPRKSGKGLGLPINEIKPLLKGRPFGFGFGFGLLCRHAASNPIASGTHTSGAQ